MTPAVREKLILNLQDMILFVEHSPTFKEKPEERDGIIAAIRTKMLEYVDTTGRAN